MDCKYISVAEAAQKLGISDRAVRQWIASGKLEAERNGRSWRILAASLEGGSSTEASGSHAEVSGSFAEFHFGKIAQMQSEMDYLRKELAETDRKLASAYSETVHLAELAEEKTDQIKHLREHITRRDGQIDALTQQNNYLTQLLAVQTKTNAALTDRLQVIDDRRRRPWWRFLGRGQ